MITLQLKTFEYGLLKAAKVLPYLLWSALGTVLANFLTIWLANYHPTTTISIAIFSVINLVYVQIENWVNAQASIDKVKATTTTVPVIAPTDVPTPPAPPSA